MVNILTFVWNAKYIFRHWLLAWKQDEEGDIALVFFNRLAFVKYKEHTIVRWDGHRMASAPRYVGQTF